MLFPDFCSGREERGHSRVSLTEISQHRAERLGVVEEASFVVRPSRDAFQSPDWKPFSLGVSNGGQHTVVYKLFHPLNATTVSVSNRNI